MIGKDHNVAEIVRTPEEFYPPIIIEELNRPEKPKVYELLPETHKKLNQQNTWPKKQSTVSRGLSIKNSDNSNITMAKVSTLSPLMHSAFNESNLKLNVVVPLNEEAVEVGSPKQSETFEASAEAQSNSNYPCVKAGVTESTDTEAEDNFPKNKSAFEVVGIGILNN